MSSQRTRTLIVPDEQFIAGMSMDSHLAHSRERELETEYEQLWAQFGPSLERLASSYEARAHAREDLLQDIQLAIWAALPRFRRDASLRTFVYRIAHNRALTHLWRRSKAVDTASLEATPDPKLNPESRALLNADRSRLMQAIRALPPPLRQVITMALEDLSHAEIGAVLGITENNVAVRLNRARNLLKENLGAE